MKRLALIALVLLAACKEETISAVPDPVVMTAEVLGHYCQMNIAEHDGPKGQIHLEGYQVPIFFGQVRDTLAYLHEPEQTARVMAIYVSDMEKAQDWTTPGADNWIVAAEAYYVVGGSALGGMGAPELVPFGTEAAALAFAADHGGEVLRFTDIPAEAVLGAIERADGAAHMEHGS